MRNITLKWSIFIFYSILGLLPLAVISYITLVSHTRSITVMTDQHVTELIQQTGAQMEDRCHNLFKYIDMLSKSPYVQLSFYQYPNGGRLSTVSDKLDIFRLNAQEFSRITLFSNQGEIVATAPEAKTKIALEPLNLDSVEHIRSLNYHHTVNLKTDSGRVEFFKTVFDYGNPERPVGLVCAEVPLSSFIEHLKKLGLGEGVEKIILDGAGEVIFKEAASTNSKGGSLREYTAELPLLDWRIIARIPEDVLYRDVDIVRKKTLIIAVVVALIAVIAVLVFSRQITRPLQTVIEGTREFASGNLDHQIEVPWGGETRKVAQEFNTMAKQLADRQADLVQAGKLASLGRLSAGFAHEFRNPLAGIKTSAQVLARRAVTPQEKALAQGISKEVDRLNKIVEDLLHFSRPREPRRMSCDFLEIANRSLVLLDARFRQKKVTVDNNVGSMQITADPDQMIQVLINLLLNALNVVEPQLGVITLEAGRTIDKEPYLSVSDNGKGVPPELVSRIFDPFFSLSDQGTGLGLSIVQTLLRRNHARLKVDSREGQGTTFTIIMNGHGAG
jgi:two-component system NtrC family sensor kinase